jgi:serine O-acetyltransferase
MGNRYMEHPFDAPKLGNRVNVGAGAKIFGNVTIGDDVQTLGPTLLFYQTFPQGKRQLVSPPKLSTTQKIRRQCLNQ